jgi:REP-associated tyrosine transposase
MARLGRYFLPDQPLHAIRRGNNRDLFHRRRLRLLRDWLAAAAAEYGRAVHASVLMTNPMHLLVTPRGPQSLPRTMQSLGRRTVRHINARYRPSGREGRYRTAPIGSEACFLACRRTIELNPVRARMVRHRRDYAWSSDNAHARRAMDPLLSGHALFDGLGASPADRRKAYRELFRTAGDADFADALRAATNGGWALGDARFKRQIAKALDRQGAQPPGCAAAEGPTARRKPDRRQLNLL